MIRNVVLKKTIKKLFTWPMSVLNSVLPKNDNIVLLYSGNQGIRHNLTPVLNKLVADGYTKKYRVVCAVEKKKYYCQIEGVLFTTHVPAIWVYLNAKHVFYTAGQIPIKPSKSQIVIHMNHGTSDLKAMGSLTKINNGDEFFFTYICVPSDLYVPIVAKEYLCPLENVAVCGEPMTDELYKFSRKYEFGNFKKVVLWMPTFRQSRGLHYNDSSESMVPLFKKDEYNELDMRLQEFDFKLIIKLHAAQDVDKLGKRELKNILILTNDEFIEQGYKIYDLMPQVDAFLGDYSSASLQFLLVDKPIGFVVPDMEEYKSKRGFCFKHPEEYMPGPLIKTKEQLYKFLRSLADGEDVYEKDRLRVRNQIFKYQDGNNTERVLKMSNIHL